MGRHLILIDFSWARDKDPRVPLGHASLLASLRGVPSLDVKGIVIPVNSECPKPEDVAAMILESSAGCASTDVDIAFGAYVWGEDLLQAVLRDVRRRGFAGRTIVGGPQISYTGPGLEGLYPEADVFVRGYGEDALAFIARTPGRPRIRGVHYAGEVDRSEQTAVDLEQLPSPWMTGVTLVVGQRFIRWETQRGCPFQCAFCQHREPGARLRKRTLSRSRVFDEVALFCRHDVQEIAVLDAIFNVNPHAIDILRAFVEGGFRGRLSLQCRAELTNIEFLDAVRMLDACLEFGLQSIHMVEGAAIHRINDMEKVDRVLAETKRRGIRHAVSLIFGLPQQTFDSFLASVRWCLERRVPVIKAFPLMLLRGTPLDRTRGRWGLRERGACMPIVVSADSFDERDWQKMARVAEALAVTEGRHPADLDGLLSIAASCEPDLRRWQSDLLWRAA